MAKSIKEMGKVVQNIQKSNRKHVNKKKKLVDFHKI